MKQPPTKLTDITLSQWVGYQNKYGQDLDNWLKKIAALPEGEEKSEEYQQYNADYHVKNYAFYTGTSLEAARTIGLYDVIKMQGAAFIELKKQEVMLNINETFSWQNDRWRIQAVYKSSPRLTKSQHDIATDIALIWSDLQDGKHEALYELCAAYMRKVDEPYSSELVYVSTDGVPSPRVQLMKSLPMNMALCVKKYNEQTIKQLLRL